MFDGFVETLRLWPPAFQTDRCCNRDYTIQAKNPNEDTLIVEKYMMTVIPILAIHRDPQYYPEPERFDPERFNDEYKPKIVPGTYMPFGIGPRNCIGTTLCDNINQYLTILQVLGLLFLKWRHYFFTYCRSSIWYPQRKLKYHYDSVLRRPPGLLKLGSIWVLSQENLCSFNKNQSLI